MMEDDAQATIWLRKATDSGFALESMSDNMYSVTLNCRRKLKNVRLPFRSSMPVFYFHKDKLTYIVNGYIYM